MPTPPPRKRFQIHLSTAIVMMFVAGGLIWANIYVGTTAIVESSTSREELERAQMEVHGWPFVCMARFIGDPDHDPEISKWRYMPIEIAADVIIVLTNLFNAWFVCEWLIRWRAARK